MSCNEKVTTMFYKMLEYILTSFQTEENTDIM